jgi:hypothetical protein
MHAPTTLVTSLPAALGPSRKPTTVPALELTHCNTSNGAPVPVVADLPAAEAALGAESAPCWVTSPVLPGSVGSVGPQGESNAGCPVPGGVRMAVIGAPVADSAAARFPGRRALRRSGRVAFDSGVSIRGCLTPNTVIPRSPLDNAVRHVPLSSSGGKPVAELIGRLRRFAGRMRNDRAG